MTLLFERFSEVSKRATQLAQLEAHRLGHNLIGTEFLFLGLLGNGTCTAAKVLKQAVPITLKDARIAVERITGRGSGFVSEEPSFTPRAKSVFALAIAECEKLNSTEVGTEHLLLALLTDGEGVALHVLQNSYDVEPSELKAYILKQLAQEANDET